MKMGDYSGTEKYLSTLASEMLNLDLMKIRLSNLINWRKYKQGIAVAQEVFSQERLPQNEFTIRALTDITQIDLGNLDNADIKANPNKYISALGALLYIKKMESAKQLNTVLLELIPQNEQLRAINKNFLL